MKERKKLIENFWNVGVNGDRDVWEDELGWPQMWARLLCLGGCRRFEI